MRILLLSRLPNRPSEQKLLEAAMARGHQLDMVKYNDVSLLVAETQRELYHPEIDDFAYDAVLARLGQGDISYGLLVLRQLELNGIYTPNPSVSLTRTHNYLRLIQLLTFKQIPVPKTFVSRTNIVSDELVTHLGLPLVIRRGRGANGSLAIETKKTLDSILQVVDSSGEPTVLQESSAPDAEYRYHALVVGGSIAASIRTHKSTPGAKAVVLPKNCHKLALKIATAVGLKMYEVELIGSDAHTKVVAVNAEPDLAYYETVTGRDVAAKIIEYIEANAKQRHRKDKVGA